MAENFSEMLALLDNQHTRLAMDGNKTMSIENPGRITYFTAELIKLEGKLDWAISGSMLYLEQLNREKMVICGQIERIRVKEHDR